MDPLPSTLAEPPHAHIVCRRCGRIRRIELDGTESRLLIHLANLRPDGWAVERIAYSLAAVCPGCATK